jgi:hypothetical protein
MNTLEQDHAHWAGNILHATFFYSWPGPHAETYELRKCDLLDSGCDYWVAADGEIFGVAAPGQQTAIITVEHALKHTGAKAVYVIWTLKDPSPSKAKAWAAKWSRRTSAPDYQ